MPWYPDMHTHLPCPSLLIVLEEAAFPWKIAASANKHARNERSIASNSPRRGRLPMENRNFSQQTRTQRESRPSYSPMGVYSNEHTHSRQRGNDALKSHYSRTRTLLLALLRQRVTSIDAVCCMTCDELRLLTLQRAATSCAASIAA